MTSVDLDVAVARDGSGVAIEVYPDGVAHHPGVGDVDTNTHVEAPQTMPWEDQIFTDGQQVRASAFHVALTTHLSDAEVLSVAHRAGLRALKCERGGVFGLVEAWLDRSLLVEVLSAPDALRYKAFMNPRGRAPMFGAAVTAAS